MNIYYKKIGQAVKPIKNIVSESMHFINIYNINHLDNHMDEFSQINALYKFMIDKKNYIYMVSFDNVFDTDYQKHEIFNDVKLSDPIIVTKKFDKIIKYENEWIGLSQEGYYQCDMKNGDKYVVEYVIYKRGRKCDDEMIPISDWYIKNNNDSTHILSIYTDIGCDEDHGVIDKSVSDEHCKILKRIFDYEKERCSDFYSYYCSMNTCNDRRF